MWDVRCEMKRLLGYILVIVLVVFIIFININFLGIKFFPSVYSSAHSGYFVQDVIGLISGYRRLAANIAWMQLLIYYGSPEYDGHEHTVGEPCPHCLHEGVYPELLRMVQRVIRLDPFFHNAYIYGAASLAWNQNRPSEALVLLKEGIENNPDYFAFYLHQSAIIYKMLERYSDMIIYLEKAIKLPDCPTLVKIILANIYEKAGNYKRAIEIWYDILSTATCDSDIQRAKREIEQLTLRRE